MMLDDKYLATARRLAILIFVLAGTATYLSIREYQRWSALNYTRYLVSYWIVIDRLQERVEIGEVLNDKLDEAFVLPQAWDTGHVDYYDGFGQVIVTKTVYGYRVSVRNADYNPEQPFLFPRIPDLRSWTLEVLRTEPIDRALSPFPRDVIELFELGQGMQKEAKKNATEEELKNIHPSWLDERRGNPRWSILESEKYQVFTQIRESLTSSGVELQKDDQVLQAYKNLERKTYSSEVKIPVIELETSPEIALWVISLMMMVLSILVVDALASITPDVTREEPWFVIDSNVLLATILSKMWLVGLSVCPIVALGFYLGTLYIRSTAGDMDPLKYRLRIGGMAVISLLATMNTIRAVIRLAALRSACINRLKEEEPKPLTEKSPKASSPNEVDPSDHE